MSANTRQTRAHSLREFLLSQALTNQLDDSILQQALSIIKLPVETLDITQLSLDQLLDEWQAGNIDKDRFLAAWAQISQEDTHESQPLLKRDVKTQGIQSWIPLLVIFALVLSAILGWLGYQFWLINRQESLASPSLPTAINIPSPTVLAEKLEQSTNPCPNCPNPLPEVNKASNEELQKLPADMMITNYVAEGMLLASMAKAAVAEYYVSMGVYPNSNAQIGLAEPDNIRSDAVSSVAVGAGGIITITYNKFVGKGQTIILYPTSTGGGPIVWNCSKGTVPVQYRPPHCR